MAKLINKKSRSFTLIELLISVSIFIVVTVMVIAILSITVSSRSKIQATDELRTEAGKVMAEIQEMVEKGNTVDGTNYGVYFEGSSSCSLASTASNSGLSAVYTDSKGIKITRKIRFNSTTKKIEKYQQIINGAVTTTQDWTSILPVDLELDTSATTNGFWGTVRKTTCTTTPTAISVSFKINGKTTGSAGTTPASITLQSTFTSKYPGPDMAGDSS